MLRLVAVVALIDVLLSFAVILLVFPISSLPLPKLMRPIRFHSNTIIHRQRFFTVNKIRSHLKRAVSSNLMSQVLDANSITSRNSSNTKDLWIIRHGQAVHNPRAEYARDVLQCSHDEFLSIMQEDDCFDAPLTTLGIEQAQQIYSQYGKSHWRTPPAITSTTPPSTAPVIHIGDTDEPSILELESKRHSVELIVSSPLTRALQTAELAFGHADRDPNDDPATATTPTIKRVCYEPFREINGWLQNGKRRSKYELMETFPSWDFSWLTSNEDDQWTPTLETTDSCMERGYDGLLWLMKERPERSIILVSHGALLKYTLTDHPHVILRDGRTHDGPTENNESTEAEQTSQPRRCVRQRYHNCELRRYRMEILPSKQNEYNNDRTDTTRHENAPPDRNVIVLTEVDL